MKTTVAVLGTLLFAGCGRRGDTEKTKEQPLVFETLSGKAPPIDYEILGLHTAPEGGRAMLVLVSPESPKEEVIALANYFFDENPTDRCLEFDIIDSRAVKGLGAREDRYDSQEYMNHHLVRFRYKPRRNMKDLEWTGKGRERPEDGKAN